MSKKQDSALGFLNDIVKKNLQFRTLETPEEKLKGEIARLITLRCKWEDFLKSAKKNNAIDLEIEFLENNIKQTKEELDVKKKELLGLSKNI